MKVKKVKLLAEDGEGAPAAMPGCTTDTTGGGFNSYIPLGSYRYTGKPVAKPKRKKKKN